MNLQGSKTHINSYLIRQLPTATVFLNKKFELVHASDKWIAAFGMADFEVIGKPIHKLFKEVSDVWMDAMKSCLKGEPGQKGVEGYASGDGQECWFEWTNLPWFDENENVIGIIISTEDITERVKRDLSYEKLEILLKDKSEIAQIGSWDYNVMTDRLQWCNMTRQIHEVSSDYEPNITSAVNFYKEGYSRNTISMAMFNAMEHKKPWCEKLEILSYTGKEKWVIAAGRPMFKNGNYIGLIGTLQDITPIVKSEIKTRESEHLLRTVIDNIPINVYIKDVESRKILVNKSECEFLEVTDPSKLLGKNDFDLYDAAFAQNSREEDLFVMNSQTPVLSRETVIIGMDGKATPFLSSKIPFNGADGQARGIIGISLDITNLKQQEAELRNLISVTSLQNKKLINFAHIISHNLRSHTANFSMLLDFLVKEKDEKEKEHIVGMLTSASNNLLETLENLNDVVAISSNTNIRKEYVNLNNKIDIVTKNLGGLIRSNKASIINNIPNDTEIQVIPAYIENILTNFFTNAIKYRKEDCDPEIVLSATTKDQYTVLSIKDNGLGIDLDKYGDKLFGMYKTFHYKKDAKGIGLYITKNQIEAMKGKIEVTSVVGEGSTFKIFFNDKD